MPQQPRAQAPSTADGDPGDPGSYFRKMESYYQRKLGSLGFSESEIENIIDRVLCDR